MVDKTTDLTNHLDEMRRRIISTLTAFVVSLIGAFIFVKDIYNWLVRGLDHKLAILGPSDILWVYMMIAGVFALAVTLPVAAYQVWKFVSPALSKEEKKVTLAFIPGLFVLFMAGLSFGYFVLFPIVLSFLTSLAAAQFETMFTADKYFRFLLNLTLPLGFLFEMPLVVMFLTRLGILNPQRLAQYRKFAYFCMIVLSVLITPPDFISDILVLIPLIVLYEISIALSRIVYRKRLANQWNTNEA